MCGCDKKIDGLRDEVVEYVHGCLDNLKNELVEQMPANPIIKEIEDMYDEYLRMSKSPNYKLGALEVLYRLKKKIQKLPNAAGAKTIKVKWVREKAADANIWILKTELGLDIAYVTAAFIAQVRQERENEPGLDYFKNIGKFCDYSDGKKAVEKYMGISI